MKTDIRSKIWDLKDNARGDLIIDFVSLYDLQIQNVGKKMTFCSPLGESAIDLTITNKYAKVHNCTVL